MKLSNETINVLKNFSTINQNLVIKEGSNITTMSAMKNIVAKAKVEEVFAKEFAIYDLNEFLSALSLFTVPDLDFQNDFVIITEEGSSKSLKYWYSDPSVVTSPTKDITMPSTEIKFNFSSDSLAEITRAASVIGAPDMVLENGKLRVTDKKNTTANDFVTELDVPESDVDYKFWFKVENLKLLPGSYSVEVSSKNISKFTNSNVEIEYFIALEPESSYDA
jgi:hypothetical protein|tara:strand:+ start:1812 stop:2474 length:663 start_codon:yes stop_codon:yes gene_type:complete